VDTGCGGSVKIGARKGGKAKGGKDVSSSSRLIAVCGLEMSVDGGNSESRWVMS
jgi:hypothetical protein